MKLRKSCGVLARRADRRESLRDPVPDASRFPNAVDPPPRTAPSAHQHPSKVHDVVGQRRPQRHTTDLGHPSHQHPIPRSVGSKLGVHRLAGRGPQLVHLLSRGTGRGARRGREFCFALNIVSAIAWHTSDVVFGLVPAGQPERRLDFSLLSGGAPSSSPPVSARTLGPPFFLRRDRFAGGGSTHRPVGRGVGGYGQRPV